MKEWFIQGIFVEKDVGVNEIAAEGI